MGNLLGLLGNIDGVHGTYYIFMHFWGQVFGFTPFSLRFPSAVAVCLATVATWRLATSLYGAHVGWIALIVAALMPRSLWAATEGRSYSFTELVAVLLVISLLRAIGGLGPQSSPRRYPKLAWVAFTTLSVLGNYLFIYLVLMQLAIGLWLLLTRSGKQNLARWTTSFAISTVLSGFILWRTYNQQHQVHWLPPISDKTVSEVFVGQYFWMTPAFACLTIGLVLAYLLGKRPKQSSEVTRRANTLCALIAAMPSALLIGYSLIRTPIYDARYLTFATPFMAVLIAAAIGDLFRTRTAIGILAILLFLATPSFIYFRSAGAKLTDWNAVALKVQWISRPGDGIIYGDYADQTPTVSRIHIGYPAAFAKVSDITLIRSAGNTIRLFDQRQPLRNTKAHWADYSRILLVSDGTHATADMQAELEIARAGFVLTRTTQLAPEKIQIFEHRHQ